MRTADGLNVLPYAYIIDRNEGLQPLAEAEACHLADGVVAALGVVEGRRTVRSAETGFVRSGGELLAKGDTLEEVCKNITALGLVAHRFRVVSEPIPRKRSGGHRAVRTVANCIGGDADLRNPLEEFLLVVSDAGFWLIRLSDPGDGKWLAFVNRPHPFCNALPLSVGRAVLNLVAKSGDTVFDPCCGSGTIPFLADRMGCTALGGDLSWRAVLYARRNLAAFDARAKILREDAAKTTRTADCIVANLPYDLYCPVQDETIRALLARFRRLAPRVALVTSQDLAPLLSELGYRTEAQLLIARHHFQRRIYLLHSPPHDEIPSIPRQST